MTETTIKQLRQRIMRIWTEPYKSHAKELMADAMMDVMRWPQFTHEIINDLHQVLLATEKAMDNQEPI